MNAEQAQQRLGQIEAFRQELKQLQAENVLTLEPEQRQQVDEHHRQLLQHFSTTLNIDADERSRQLSLGMRAASFFGALALAASLFFLFHQFWGLFSEIQQAGILLGTSLGTFALTVWLHGHDRSGYYTKLAALLAFVAFVLNLSLAGQIFNITPSDKALIPWGMLAFLLAYQCNLRLLLAAGLICVGGYIAARVGAFGGGYWLSVGNRPENFFPSAVLLFCVPLLIKHSRFAGFAALYRVFALLFVFLPVLVLSFWGEGSYLALDATTVESLYQYLGFVLAGLGVWLGIACGWREVSNTSTVFGVLYLYTKLFDWWWEELPKYLFFLALGVIAVLLLVLLQRLRRYAVKASGGAV
ncbi:putative membrane protein [Pseudomonas sp. TE3786]